MQFESEGRKLERKRPTRKCRSLEVTICCVMSLFHSLHCTLYTKKRGECFLKDSRGEEKVFNCSFFCRIGSVEAESNRAFLSGREGREATLRMTRHGKMGVGYFRTSIPRVASQLHIVHRDFSAHFFNLSRCKNAFLRHLAKILCRF